MPPGRVAPVLSLSYYFLNTFFWSIPLLLFTFPKLLIPTHHLTVSLPPFLQRAILSIICCSVEIAV